MAPLKLFWSSRSPFVRNVMIAFHELGMAGQVERIAVAVTGFDAVPSLEVYNPLGQIPTLVLSDGAAVIGSEAIIDFTDDAFGSRTLLPVDYPRRLEVLRRNKIALGMMEKSLRMQIERFRADDELRQRASQGYRRSVGVSLDWLEGTAAAWAASPVDAGHICTAAALGYLDFRFQEMEWRTERPALAAWHASFATRPSYVATEFSDQ